MRKQIAVWDPFRMMSNDIFDRSLRDMWADDNPTDVYDDSDRVYVEVSIPGFNKENIDINVEDQLLTVSGKVEKKSDEDKDKNYYSREISIQSFTKSVTLPTKVQPDKAKASFRDGILKIELPKAPEVMPKKIEISVD